MQYFLAWYFFISLVGFITFPLVYRLFPALPSKGYVIARIFGLMLWGYIFWILTSLGITANDVGGILFAFAILLSLSAWILKNISEDLRTWMCDHWTMIVVVEVLFFITFAGWSIVRAANPEILGTEKPMELAFINAIMRSQTFPPNDPWLSGYSISYYYFGYVLVAMMAKTTGSSGGVAFNLGLSMIFALSALGAYGILYDLLETYKEIKQEITNSPIRISPIFQALWAPLWVLIVSNIEGFLHVLHTRGILWRFDSQGNLTSSFWKWLDLRELSQPPSTPFSWFPSQHWWWWRASRVVQDYDLSGQWKEIINEFPFFSYLLGDLHPHVLAMPFSLLAMTFALHLFINRRQDQCDLLGQKVDINKIHIMVAGLLFGGLAFLNTWDFPIYVAIFCVSYLLRKIYYESWNRRFLLETFVLGLAVSGIGFALYLPFYLGFSSQVGGILPNLINPTRGAHLWVMFVSLSVPLFTFLVYLWKSSGIKSEIIKGLFISSVIILIFWIASLLFGFIIVSLPILGDIYLASLGVVGDGSELFRQSITRRFVYPGGWITLLALLGITIGAMFVESKSKINPDDFLNESQEKKGEFRLWSVEPLTTHYFCFLLILSGTLLVLIPEFFFLRDQFGWRMNTIFKFYYQAWLLWGIASAYGVVIFFNETKGSWRFGVRLIITLILSISLIYPILSLWSKTFGFNPPNGFTLDGTRYFEMQSPNEMAAIRWLQVAPPGVVLEAIGPNGGSYTEYARISTLTGLPTVLGWVGHESQWRGGSKEMGNRVNDVELIYRSNNWESVEKLIRQYNIRYIFIGSLERSRYNVYEKKFEQHTKLVFNQGNVKIYEIP